MKNFLRHIADLFKGYDRREDDYYIDNIDINRSLMYRYHIKPIILQDSKGQIEIDPIAFPYC